MEEIIKQGLEWIAQNPVSTVSAALLLAAVPITLYATIVAIKTQNESFRKQDAIEEKNRLECMDCPIYTSGRSPCEKYFKD